MRRTALAALALLLLAPAVALPAPAAATAPPGAYVALGDSYAAGPGIPDEVDAGCLRSDHNYPWLVAAALQVNVFRDVTCSGATTVDVTGPQNTSFATRPPQLDAVGPDTVLVTLTIGGNDIGFASIVATCTVLSIFDPFGAPCTEHFTAGGVDTLGASIAATGPQVGAVLQAIHRRAPHARVLVVGYPHIIPDTGGGCWPLVPIAAGDLPYLRGVEAALNAMLAAQASLHQATYVDTFTPSTGHDACQAIGTKWVEGLLPTSPSIPVHPNALGMQADAADVLAALG